MKPLLSGREHLKGPEMVISIVAKRYQMDTCNKIPQPNMPDTRNAKDCHT